MFQATQNIDSVTIACINKKKGHLKYAARKEIHTAVSISIEELCLLIEQAAHMTLLLPVALMSCHASTVGLADCMTLGFSSYLHGTDVLSPWRGKTLCVLQLS